MTRGHVLLIGLGVFALGGLALVALQGLGLEGPSAGIWAEALLVLVVMVWIGSYGWRVTQGDMTFMQMRRRYRQRYDSATDAELQRRFEALSETEQQALLDAVGQHGAGAGSAADAPSAAGNLAAEANTGNTSTARRDERGPQSTATTSAAAAAPASTLHPQCHDSSAIA